MLSRVSFSSPLILALLLACLSAASAQLCHLCATPSALPVNGRWSHRFANGETCQSIYIQLASMQASNPTCPAKKNMAQNTCCNPSAVVSSTTPATTPNQPAPYNGPVGNQPRCPICGTDEYPGKPNAFVVARYVGEFTCDQLYGRGNHGMIPSYMCGPLQDFARAVCGCGAFNPQCQANPNNCYRPPVTPATTPAVVPQRLSLTASPRAAPRNGNRSLRGSEEVEDAVPPPPQDISEEPVDFHFESRELTEEEARQIDMTVEYTQVEKPEQVSA